MPEAARDDRLVPTDRTRLRRARDRADPRRSTVAAILDEGLVCHVGFGADGGTYVVPMAYARDGDHLYLHGAAANRTLRALAGGADACVTVTLLDGLVLARSAFHHSINYRSVMLLGRAARVSDHDEMRRASALLLDHVAWGRSADARPPTEAELTATLMVRFPIDEGSAKIRRGPPIDDPEDLDLDVWAGVIPLDMVAGEPVADPELAPDVAVPRYARPYRRPGWRST